jgi:hypothetical protein
MPKCHRAVLRDWRLFARPVGVEVELGSGLRNEELRMVTFEAGSSSGTSTS